MRKMCWNKLFHYVLKFKLETNSSLSCSEKRRMRIRNHPHNFLSHHAETRVPCPPTNYSITFPDKAAEEIPYALVGVALGTAAAAEAQNTSAADSPAG